MIPTLPLLASLLLAGPPSAWTPQDAKRLDARLKAPARLKPLRLVAPPKAKAAPTPAPIRSFYASKDGGETVTCTVDLYLPGTTTLVGSVTVEREVTILAPEAFFEMSTFHCSRLASTILRILLVPTQEILLPLNSGIALRHQIRSRLGALRFSRSSRRIRSARPLRQEDTLDLQRPVSTIASLTGPSMRLTELCGPMITILPSMM